LYMKRKKLGRQAPDLITKHLPDDLIMTPAWVDYLRWSIGEPKILAEFRADTGCDFTPRLTSIDRMIDEATWRERAFVKQYVAWFNENVWGEE
jgi:hypothetical protein